MVASLCAISVAFREVKKVASFTEAEAILYLYHSVRVSSVRVVRVVSGVHAGDLRGPATTA